MQARQRRQTVESAEEDEIGNSLDDDISDGNGDDGDDIDDETDFDDGETTSAAESQNTTAVVGVPDETVDEDATSDILVDSESKKNETDVVYDDADDEEVDEESAGLNATNSNSQSAVVTEDSHHLSSTNGRLQVDGTLEYTFQVIGGGNSTGNQEISSTSTLRFVSYRFSPNFQCNCIGPLSSFKFAGRKCKKALKQRTAPTEWGDGSVEGLGAPLFE